MANSKNKSKDNDEKISTVYNPNLCKKDDCGNWALSRSQYCWKHMPPEERANYKNKIEEWHKKGKSLKGFNLQNAQIPKIHLEKADLTDANFFRAKLPDSFFYNANLTNAELDKANLSGSDLSEANLSEAVLVGTHLTKAKLIKVNLSKADVRGATISEADLQNSNIIKANLNYSDLSGSDLRGANLSKSFIQHANLSNAILRKAKLINANLRKSKLIKADLVDANLSNAKLMGADLSEALLTFAKLPKANCRLAKFNKADLASSTLIETNFHDADLSEARFWSAKLQNAIFRGADLTKAKGLRISLFTEKLSEIEKNNPEKYQESYLFVKNYFLRMGPTDDASEAAFREKTLQRLSYSKIFWRQMEAKYKTKKLETRKKGIGKFLQKIRYIFYHPFISLKTFLYILFWRLYAALCGYGERPLRTIISAIIIFLTYGILYRFLGSFEQNQGLWDSLYFSIVTFTTLGLGDVVPNPTSILTRLLVASEAFIGAFIIGLFIWTLARKGAAR